ncbi:hypothetical protein SUGI_0478810 [Cryptomeria japonica]|uniref:uncharacterized protein LOC131027982 n=1 Tax=Cryptomeria japonica TaxID=3369 RepID=UPI002408C374|nr:uncharacterized protein LOC131027982 [Cryptomeria japonica]GLJ25011.1 hypothetical protein SUGI_0478810 [Cryptomeria japonica]
MKWICLLSFLLIFFMWALAESNPHARPNLHVDQELVCGMNLACGSGTMKEFDTRNKAHMEKRSILENEGGYGEDASVSTLFSEESIHRDYAVSDPPPVTRKPSKEPVHYRIFRTPPISSPIP